MCNKSERDSRISNNEEPTNPATITLDMSNLSAVIKLHYHYTSFLIAHNIKMIKNAL